MEEEWVCRGGDPGNGTADGTHRTEGWCGVSVGAIPFLKF